MKDKELIIKYWQGRVCDAVMALHVWQVALKSWSERDEVSDKEFMAAVSQCSAWLGDWLDADKNLDVLREAVTGVEVQTMSVQTEYEYLQTIEY